MRMSPDRPMREEVLLRLARLTTPLEALEAMRNKETYAEGYCCMIAQIIPQILERISPSDIRAPAPCTAFQYVRQVAKNSGEVNYKRLTSEQVRLVPDAALMSSRRSLAE